MTSPVVLRPEIAALPAYRQGRQAAPGGFKLSSNENPYEPLPGVLEAVAAQTAINRYPDATAAALRERLGARYGLGADQVLVGAGSVSLLQQFMLAAAGRGDEIVYPWRSFEAYPLQVAITGATGVQVPNRPDHAIDLDGLAAAVTERTRVVVVCTPNNPTGTVVDETAFLRFMDAVPSTALVLLDEAYAEFTDRAEAVDGVPLLERFPNLVVLRTFSKAYGLAGLRVGYALGDAELLGAAQTAGIPLSVTAVAEAAALASLDAEPELLDRVAEITARRDRLQEGLVEQGWPVPRSSSNFLWLPVGAATAEIAEALMDAGFVVRAFPPEGLRISVGEAESVDSLLRATASLVHLLPTGARTAG